MSLLALLLSVACLIGGIGLGWILASRPTTALRRERDDLRARFDRSIVELAGASEKAKDVPVLQSRIEMALAEREEARVETSALRSALAERDKAFEAQLTELRQAKDALSAQFSEVGAKLLEDAQRQFLERADARFKQSEETAGQGLKALLQPVNDRLQRYEEAVTKIEAERRDAFGLLNGQIEAMRIGQDKVQAEAAKLVNSLRSAPKARGRWGEQQLRNVLESCGLSEHADFATEVSVTDDDQRYRPDVIIKIPGGRTLVIDAKVSLNAYQDAFGAVDEAERQLGLAQHAAAMKAHVNGLGNKAYQTRFAETADYVVMFVPGEHFLSAALEHDPTLWDFAFEKRVLLATPTNLIAIARTVAAVWRQEKLAQEAQEIGKLGKEMYERLSVAAGKLKSVGSGLNTAVKNYNDFVSSFDSRVMVTGRKFKALNIETNREIEDLAQVELLAKDSGADLLPAPDAFDGRAEAAE